MIIESNLKIMKDMCYNMWLNVFKLLFCKIVIWFLYGYLKVFFKDNMIYSYLGRILY